MNGFASNQLKLTYLPLNIDQTLAMPAAEEQRHSDYRPPAGGRRAARPRASGPGSTRSAARCRCRASGRYHGSGSRTKGAAWCGCRGAAAATTPAPAPPSGIGSVTFSTPPSFQPAAPASPSFPAAPASPAIAPPPPPQDDGTQPDLAQDNE
ncbi:MAG: hypothetical protein MZV65_44700 [Chromatiales bacterium]|nr:hypothetical protein [Chromatiales bacterium]